MGVFSVDIEIARPPRGTKWVKLKHVLVDRGAELSWIPEDILKEARIRVDKKDQLFQMANEQTISRDIDFALIRCGEFMTNDEAYSRRKATWLCWVREHLRDSTPISILAGGDWSPLGPLLQQGILELVTKFDVRFH